MTKRLSEVLEKMKMSRNSPELVRDWRTLIPEDSRWNPNDPGNPACKVCEGTGYLRIADLPIGHPYFGKIILCDCARRPEPALNEEYGAVPSDFPRSYANSRR